MLNIKNTRRILKFGLVLVPSSRTRTRTLDRPRGLHVWLSLLEPIWMDQNLKPDSRRAERKKDDTSGSMFHYIYIISLNSM